MQRTNHEQKLASSRRTFLKSAGALAAGLSVARPAIGGAVKETLAVNGGPKAVTYPKAGSASRTPRSG